MTNTTEKTLIIEEVKSGDKVTQIVYGKVLSGKHAGKVIRVYYTRPKDGVVVGKDVESKTTIHVGKFNFSEEFRNHFGLKSNRKTKDYTNILEQFNTAINETPIEEPIVEEVVEEVKELVTVTKGGTSKKSKK